MMKKALLGITGFAAAGVIGLLLSPAAHSSNTLGSSTPVTIASTGPGGERTGPADGVRAEDPPKRAAEQFAAGRSHLGQHLGSSTVRTSALEDGTVCVQIAFADGTEVTSCGDQAAYQRGDILVAFQATEASPTVMAGASPTGLTAVDVGGRAAQLGDGSWAVEAAGKPGAVTTKIGATQAVHRNHR